MKNHENVLNQGGTFLYYNILDINQKGKLKYENVEISNS